MEVLSIADDMTGALEAGTAFAERGLDSVVVLKGNTDARVVVIDTESRHLAPSAAEEKVGDCAVRGARLVYKKTDSTLRGNIGAELRGLARAYGPCRIAYVPAYPKLGRTVRDGCLYVNGVPVHLTRFGHDELNPVTDCTIRRLVGSDLPCDVFDGESDEDVTQAAREVLGRTEYRIVAGPAAIAKAIAQQLNPDHAQTPRWPEVRRCLVVNGSRHETSIQQIDIAVANGWIRAAGGSCWTVLSPVFSHAGSAADIVRALGCAVRDHVSGGGYDAIMVFGGDTAFGVASALGLQIFRPVGELLPGVACSKAGPFTFITKAGGFGDPDVIFRIQRLLQQEL